MQSQASMQSSLVSVCEARHILAITDPQGLPHIWLRKVFIQKAEVITEEPNAGLAYVIHIHVARNCHDTTKLCGLAKGKRQ